MKAFVFFLSLFCIFSVHALDCSPINLVTSLDSPFSKIPVYDQKNSNICYAFSAAQMIDFYLIKNGAEKRNVHPAWLAMNYALGRNRKGLDIGHTKDSIERLNEVNNCDYEKVSSALINWVGTTEFDESKIIAFIEKYSDPSRSPASTDSLARKMLGRLRKLAMTPVDAVSKIISPFCGERARISVPKVNKYNYSYLPDDQAFENFMIEQIGNHHSPFSIAYCSKVWKDPEYDGIDMTFFGKRDSLKKDCNYHESLIVGRKTSGNSCHLLVRNTWGTQWKSGNKQWKCLCRDNSTGRWIDDCEYNTHSGQQYSVEACWIPSDKLARNVGVVTFMEKQ